MGEGNHLSATGNVRQAKGRWMWFFGGTAVVIVTGGLLMQYLYGTVTKAASDPPAGNARVGGAKKPEILARVSQETITYDMVAEEAVKRYGKEVLDDLIHRLIIQQACEEHKITVTEQEITDEIGRIAKRFNLDVSQWLQMLQAERNISPVQYRQSVIFPMLALKKLAGDEVEIDEKELKEAFIRDYGPRVKARMIMFDRQRLAQECWDKLSKNPDDFEEMAQKHSIDQNSRALGGQIPPIPRFSGNDNIEKAAFKLKNGDISGIIEAGPSRFVILKCEGRTEPVVHDMEEVKSVLYDGLKEQKVQLEVAKIFDEIKKKTIVDNFLTGSSNRPERAAGGIGRGNGPQNGDVQPASAVQSKQKAMSADRTSNSNGGGFGGGGTKPSRN